MKFLETQFTVYLFVQTCTFKCGFLIFIRTFQGNDVKFKVRINERGTRFSEKIKINEKENTVRFTVPKHNDVDQSEILHDFNLVYDKQINIPHRHINYYECTCVNLCFFITSRSIK